VDPGGEASEGGDSHGAGDIAGNSGGPTADRDGAGLRLVLHLGIANSADSAGSPGGSFGSGSSGQSPAVKATDTSLTPDGYQSEQSATVMAVSSGQAIPNGPVAPDPRSEKESDGGGESRQGLGFEAEAAAVDTCATDDSV